jgi:hypothetical protein
MEPVSYSAADLLPAPRLNLDSLLPIPSGDGAQPDPVPQISPVGQGDRPSNPGIASDVYPTENGFRGDVTTKTGDLSSVRVRETGAYPRTPSVRIRGDINNIVGDGKVGVGLEVLPHQVRPRVGFGLGGAAGVTFEQRIPLSGGPSTKVTGVQVPLGSGLSGAVTYVDPPGQGREQTDVELVWTDKDKDTKITGVYTKQSSGPRGGLVVQYNIGGDRMVTVEVSGGGHRDTGRDEWQVRTFFRSILP